VERKLVVGSALFHLVVEHLRRGLSPEQIACTLSRMDEPVRLSHETIYTALYAMPRGQLRVRSSPCCAAHICSAEGARPVRIDASPSPT
jgi:IS30 family transposase